MSHPNKMGEMPVGPLLFQMGIPLMISLLVQSLYNIVDSIFVAHYSEKALTATSLVYSVQFLMIAIGVGTAVGLNALLSRKIGAKKTEEACQVATTGMILTAMTAAVFSIIGFCFADKIACVMTTDQELQELCRQYMSINLIFCWGLFFQTYAQRLLQAVGDTVLSMVSLLIGAVTNMILDPIMIFGLFGCPEMGIAGAAYATVIAQSASAIATLVMNRKKNPVIHVHFRGYRFLWKDVADIYRVGMPTIVMQATGSVMTFSVNRILMTVSPSVVAFFGIYYKLQNFLMMPVNGLGQATIPIVGYNYGNGRYDRVLMVRKVLYPSGIAFALAGTVIFMVFPGQLLALFAASPEMLEFGITALRIISVTFICSVITILSGYLASGLGNGVINMIGNAFRQLIFLVPCLWILLQLFGMEQSWFAFWIAEAAGCVYSYFATARLMKRKL